MISYLFLFYSFTLLLFYSFTAMNLTTGNFTTAKMTVTEAALDPLKADLTDPGADL
jgi:hypothetical protein